MISTSELLRLLLRVYTTLTTRYSAIISITVTIRLQVQKHTKLLNSSTSSNSKGKKCAPIACTISNHPNDSAEFLTMNGKNTNQYTPLIMSSRHIISGNRKWIVFQVFNCSYFPQARLSRFQNPAIVKQKNVAVKPQQVKYVQLLNVFKYVRDVWAVNHQECLHEGGYYGHYDCVGIVVVGCEVQASSADFAEVVRKQDLIQTFYYLHTNFKQKTSTSNTHEQKFCLKILCLLNEFFCFYKNTIKKNIVSSPLHIQRFQFQSRWKLSPVIKTYHFKIHSKNTFNPVNLANVNQFSNLSNRSDCIKIQFFMNINAEQTAQTHIPITTERSSNQITTQYRQLSYRQFYNWACWLLIALFIIVSICIFWCYVFIEASKVFDTQLGFLSQSSYASIIQWQQGYCKDKSTKPALQNIEYVTFKPSNKVLKNITTLEQIDKQLKASNDTVICYKLSLQYLIINSQIYSKDQLRTYYLLSDGLFCLLLLLSLLFVHFVAGRLQPCSSSLTIDRYSLQITNLPLLPKHTLLPSLKHYLQQQVCHRFLLQDFQIFDIESSFDEFTTKYHILLRDCHRAEEQLGFMETFNYPDRYQQKATVDRLKLELLAMDSQKQKMSRTEVVWVTCQSVADRWKILQTFKVNSVSKVFRGCVGRCWNATEKRFMDKDIVVEKTSQPEEINWQNLYVTRARKFIIRLAFYIMCIVFLVGFNITILVVQNSIIPSFVSPFIIIMMAAILKWLLIWFSSFQKYKLKTREHSSSMVKLTICQYINMGVIIFISSYKLPNAVSFLTNRKYQKIYSVQWMKDVGVTFVLTLTYQIITSNFLLFGPFIWKKIKSKLRKIRQNGESMESISSFRSKHSIEQAKLYESYADLLAPLLLCMTYCHLFPILYPILFVLFFTNLLSLKYLHTHLLSPPACSDGHLHTTASKLVFLSICLHFLSVYFTFSTRIHLWFLVSLLTLYFFREILFKYFIALMRKMKGPICQSVVAYVNRQCGKLQFGQRRGSEKIEELQRRRNIVAEQIKVAGNQEDLKWLQKEIDFLNELENNVREMSKDNTNTLRGRISYSFLGQDTVCKT